MGARRECKGRWAGGSRARRAGRAEGKIFGGAWLEVAWAWLGMGCMAGDKGASALSAAGIRECTD